MKTKLLLLALAVSLTTPSYGQSPYENRNLGMTMGALMGGLGGAAIGDHNNRVWTGAAIGTAVGALTGAAVGDSVDTNIARERAYRQQAYEQQRLRQSVTVHGVISMAQSGLSEDVIITHIQTTGLAHRLQPNDLVLLSQSGVSDRVIRAMQTAPLAASPAPASAPVTRDRVIVEQHHYVRPYHYPRYYYHRPPPRPRTHIHYGITIGR